MARFAKLPTLRQYVGPTCAMDRPVDASTTQQAAVGGIHDGIHILSCDVALHECQLGMSDY